MIKITTVNLNEQDILNAIEHYVREIYVLSDSKITEITITKNALFQFEATVTLND